MDVKSRLLRFVSHTGMSKRKFQERIGVSNSYIQNISEGIGADVLNRITIQFPELNSAWLLTGSGDMLKGESLGSIQQNTETAKHVPLVPVCAQGGSLNDFVMSVKSYNCESVVSPVNEVDMAIQISGESMAPEYPGGSRIFIKKINERAFIEWGKAYVLDTCNGTVVKILTPGEKEGYVKCLSINPDPIYAPFEVCLKDVYGIYRVMLCLSIK